jgi:hypothetical protein
MSLPSGGHEGTEDYSTRAARRSDPLSSHPTGFSRRLNSCLWLARGAHEYLMGLRGALLMTTQNLFSGRVTEHYKPQIDVRDPDHSYLVDFALTSCIKRLSSSLQNLVLSSYVHFGPSVLDSGRLHELRASKIESWPIRKDGR